MVLPAAAAAPADTTLAGEWRVRNEIAGNVSEMTCTFTQKGTELTGGCATDQSSIELKGTVEERSVRWVSKTLYEGNPLTLTYVGTLGDEGLKGTVTVEEFSVTGDFTASPVKK
jgi:hypothetical protein